MFDLIKSKLENKRVLLLGYGREGRSTYRLIRRVLPEYPMTIADQNLQIAEDEVLKQDHFLEFRLGDDYLQGLYNFDLIIKSPGITLKDISYNIASDSITSQTDFFLLRYSSQVVGVTGTKGKSTTSTLIHHILKVAEKKAILMGNIGRPAFDFIDDISPDTIMVYELSSHQLEYLTRSPHVAIILNFYQEHLDAYRSFEDYQLAKMNIAKYQIKGDHLIYNYDDQRVMSHINTMDIQGGYAFSMSNQLENGCSIRDNQIIYSSDGKKEAVFDLRTKIRLKGDHNLMNIMAGICACKEMGVDNQIIAEGISSFRGLEHRIEYVGEIGGIHFYNDSIATIPEACIEAIKSLENVNTLILGGFDRGIDYRGLAKFLATSDVKNIIFTGDAGNRIFHEIKSFKKSNQNLFLISKFEDFREIAFEVTEKGSICLLSPAAASYDEFPNFEVRGKRFKELILGWK